MIRKTAVTAGVLAVLAGLFLPAAADESASRVEAAVTLYSTRHIEPGNLEKSGELLQDILASEPGNVRALCELSRVSYLRGDRAKTSDEKLSFYNKGAECAKQAIRYDDNAAWGHIWYAVNLGRIGQTKGVMNSLFMVKDIRRELERALALDPGNPVALNVRAVVNYSVPRLFGGSITRSIEDLEKALARDPSYSLAYVEMGNVYVKKKDYAKAREYLTRLLSLEKPTYAADYALADRPAAEAILKKIEKK